MKEAEGSGAGKVGVGGTVIGVELPKDLGATVGDKLRVATADGASETLTITGLFDLGNKGVSAHNVYVGLRTAINCSSSARNPKRCESGYPYSAPASSAQNARAFYGSSLDAYREPETKAATLAGR